MRSASPIALALLAVAAGLPGCAANGSSPSFGQDGGGGASDMSVRPFSDGGEPTSDLGVPFDSAFANLLSIKLRAPAPLASALPTSQELDFDVVLNDASQNEVENWLTIAPRNATSPAITAGFVWTAATGGGFGAYSLHVIPTAPLDDLTDYTVHVIDQHVFRPVLATGFSTGSRPRLSAATLNAQNNGAMVWIDLQFSEGMNASSIAPALTVSSGGAPIAGTVTSSAAAAYRFTFAGGASGVSGPVTIDLTSAATATSGAALLLDDWDTPTTAGADGGAPTLEVTFPSVVLTSNASVTWAPVVN